MRLGGPPAARGPGGILWFGAMFLGLIPVLVVVGSAAALGEPEDFGRDGGTGFESVGEAVADVRGTTDAGEEGGL